MLKLPEQRFAVAAACVIVVLLGCLVKDSSAAATRCERISPSNSTSPAPEGASTVPGPTTAVPERHFSFEANHSLVFLPKSSDDQPYTMPAIKGTLAGRPGALASRTGIRSSSFYVTHAQTLPDLYPRQGLEQHTFDAAFAVLQADTNSGQNIHDRIPPLEISLYLVSQLNVSQSVQWMHNEATAALLPPGSLPTDDAVDRFTVQRNGSTDWVDVTWSFHLKAPCIACRVVIEIGQPWWVSYWGNSYHFGNLTLTQRGLSVPPRQQFHVRDAEVVTIPVMPQPYSGTWTAPANVSCPHLEQDLALWHDASAWPSGSVPSADGSTIVTLPANTSMLLQACALPNSTTDDATSHLPFGLIVIPAGSSLILDDDDITLHTRGILVYGALHVGSPSCRIERDVNIVLHGNSSDSGGTDLSQPTKGIVALGGTIDMHGKLFYTWSRLAETAFAGDDVLVLQEPVNWLPGQEVVIVTTVWNDEESPQNEVAQVLGVDATGHRVLISRRLQYTHYAGSEYQGEVALLSRCVRVSGHMPPVSAGHDVDQTFGGHILVTGAGSHGRFSGVEARHMGQKNRLARYPFHFHLMSDAPDSFVRGCSVVASFYRCVVIHGTSLMEVSSNTAFDVHGHCYYLEDGIEEHNIFEFNLAAYVHTIYDAARGFGQGGERFVESDDLRNPADTSAAGFYITNAYNVFRGNVASGGWTGFAFPNLPTPINTHRELDLSDTRRNPDGRPLLVFEGNTAHSSGYHWNRGSCVYVGGRLRHRSSDGLLEYQSGRVSRNTYDNDGDHAFMIFNNTLVFLCQRGVNHWGNRVELHRFAAHDIKQGAVLFGRARILNGLINGRSGNGNVNDLDMGSRGGFQFYDTWTQTLLDNVTFRNFVYEHGDRVIFGMTHSDTFKPQGIAATRQIRYDNCDRECIIDINREATGASWIYNIKDADGTLSLSEASTIVGSHESWWNIDSTCRKDHDWGVWLCDRLGREIVYFQLEADGFTRTEEERGQFESHRHIGYMSLFERPDETQLILTKNPGVAGVSDTVWRADFFGGSPRAFRLASFQIPRGKAVVLAVPYPANTTFSVVAWQKYFSETHHSIRQATSRDEVLNTSEPLPSSGDGYICGVHSPRLCDAGTIGPAWYFDGEFLFLRLVDLAHYADRYYDRDDSEYERDGLALNDIELGFEWHIEANCTQECTESPTCYNPTSSKLPPAVFDIPQADRNCTVPSTIAVATSAATTASSTADMLTTTDAQSDPNQNSSILDSDLGLGLATALPVAVVLIVVVVLLARSKAGHGGHQCGSGTEQTPTRGPWLTAHSKVSSCTDMSVCTNMTDAEAGEDPGGSTVHRICVVDAESDGDVEAGSEAKPAWTESS